MKFSITDYYDYQNEEFIGTCGKENAEKELFNLYKVDFGNSFSVILDNTDDYPVSEDGKYDEDEIKKWLEEDKKSFEGTKVEGLLTELISAIGNKCTKGLINAIKRELRKKIYTDTKYPTKKLKDDLDKIKDIKITTITFGTFMPPNKITIYMKAICGTSKKRNFNFQNMFNGIFLHECYHLGHYIGVITSGGKWKKGKHATIVKESLASCFEYESYSDCCDKALMDWRMNSWKAYDMKRWPYSGALYLYYDENNSGTVHDDSLVDFEKAYKDIVEYSKNSK